MKSDKFNCHLSIPRVWDYYTQLGKRMAGKNPTDLERIFLEAIEEYIEITPGINEIKLNDLLSTMSKKDIIDSLSSYFDPSDLVEKGEWKVD